MTDKNMKIEEEEIPEIKHVEFAPGVLEDLEENMDPAELQELMDMIAEKLKDGSFFTDAEPVDMDKLFEEDPELYERLVNMSDEIDDLPPIVRH